MNTIHGIGDRAHQENWRSHQQICVIAQDSANINFGIEHDYVTNILKGGDESHIIATLSRMFHVLAQKVKSVQCKSNVLQELEAVHPNSIWTTSSLQRSISFSNSSQLIHKESVQILQHQ
jgi:hypothetical protein